jgi:3D (Asp-Asp-Asp) domain-containing protein
MPWLALLPRPPVLLVWLPSPPQHASMRPRSILPKHSRSLRSPRLSRLSSQNSPQPTQLSSFRRARAHQRGLHRSFCPMARSTPLPQQLYPPSANAAKPVTPELPGLSDTKLRFFNGRPVRAARSIRMLVTAYSPDERSCPGTADNITASLHHVATNDFRSVAADTRILPLGSMITIDGYDSGRIVPVLDRGGAIKGNRLDVLFPTHEQALKWGKRWINVTVWQYADGQARCDWRAYRDNRN